MTRSVSSLYCKSTVMQALKSSTSSLLASVRSHGCLRSLFLSQIANDASAFYFGEDLHEVVFNRTW
jgi:hypothetical protein